MFRHTRPIILTAFAAALAALVAGAALGQSKGRIVCWKDKAGKVVGCGDRVPPEYQDAATRELDKSGMTRRTTGTAEEEARLAAEKAAIAERKEEEKKQLAEQRRKDMVLLNTYAHEREIDQRRDRELQVVDRQIDQYQIMHRNAAARHKEIIARFQAAEKDKKPSDVIKEEAARAQADMAKLQGNIAAKEKEKGDIRARYAQTRQRYVELRGGGSHTTAPAKK